MNRVTLLGTVSAALVLLICSFPPRFLAAETDGSIFIRPNGSVDPPTAPILRSGNTYSLTGNIYNKTIIIQKDAIVVDGKGHTVQGTGISLSKGLDLTNRESVTVKNMKVAGFHFGIWLDSSQLNKVYGNTIFSCVYAISVTESSSNGIYLNNFLSPNIRIYGGLNSWDNGYPEGGNFWGDYNRQDHYLGPSQNVEGSDGIDDLWHDIDEDNFDNYPLMGKYSVYEMMSQSGTYFMHIVSNSTISSVTYNSVSRSASFYVSGDAVTGGFCRVCIPHTLIEEPYKVLVDDQAPLYMNDNLHDNGTHRWMYFSYDHPSHVVISTVGGIPSDVVPPEIAVLSPENKTYTINSVALGFTINEPTSWIGYSLDGKDIVTITGNTTLTDLPEGAHSITVYARDTSGNVGCSGTVYFTISVPVHDVTIESVTISSAEVYEGDVVDITVAAKNNGDFTETFNVTVYANSTIIETQTVSNLGLSAQTILTFTWNTAGFSLGNYTTKAEVSIVLGETNTTNNVRVGGAVRVVPVSDVVPPEIDVLSPDSRTYITDSVDLRFIVNEPVSLIGYSLDREANITITGNTTLTGLLGGTHSITVYAVDTSGNTGSSDTVYFTISIPVHDIDVQSVVPSSVEVPEGDSVDITVVIQNNGNFTETFSVSAYANNALIETHTVSNLAPAGQTTLIFTWDTARFSLGEYMVKAEASIVLGETNTTNNVRVGSAVHVIPESSPFSTSIVSIVVIFIIGVLGAIVYRRKHSR